MRRYIYLANLLCLLLCTCILSPCWAEKDNFKFAEGLTKLRHFDLAKEIFEQILADKSLSLDKQQEGRLGLCILLKDAAPFETNVVAQLEKYREGEKAFKDFVDQYPDHPKVSDGYALNELATIIQAKADLIIRIVEESEDYPQEEKGKIQNEAKASLEESHKIYELLKNTPLDAQEKLRIEYYGAYNKYLQAKVFPSGTYESMAAFEDAITLFEDLLWNVSGQVLGYYCNYYLGLSHAGLALPNRDSDKGKDEYQSAKLNFEAITRLLEDESFWSDYGQTGVKDMVERAFFRAGSLSNEFNFYQDTLQFIDIMKSRFKVEGFYPLPENFWTKKEDVEKLLRMQAPQEAGELKKFIQELPEDKKGILAEKIRSIFKEPQEEEKRSYGYFGLLALLEQGVAFFRSDDLEKALSLAKSVLAVNNPATNKRAQELISRWIREGVGEAGDEAIDLEALFAAGKGNQASEKHYEAIDLFQKVIAGCRDETQVNKFMGEAWNRTGHSYWKLRQYYEAGIAFSEGAKYRTDEEVAQNSAYRAYRAYAEAYRITKDKEDERLRNEARETYIKNFGGGGGLVYEKANEEKTEGNYEDAIKDYQSVSNKERKYWMAQVQIGDCYRLLGEDLLKEKKDKKAQEMFQEGLKVLERFEKNANEFRTTDPLVLDEIGNARVYTAFYKGKIYEDLNDYPAVEKLLGKFETDHSGVKVYNTILDPVLFTLLKAYLVQEKMDEAESTVKKLQARSEQSIESVFGSRNLGNKLAELAEKHKKDNREKYLELLSKAADYLYFWVARVKAGFFDTFRIGLMYFDLQNWERAEALLKTRLYDVYKDRNERKRMKIPEDQYQLLLIYLGKTYFLQDRFHDAKNYYEEYAGPTRTKTGLTVKTKNREVIFELATLYGGSVRDKGDGRYEEFFGVENFKDALDLYIYVIIKIRDEGYTEDYINARFHQALMEYRLRNPDNAKRIIKSLEAAVPGFKGRDIPDEKVKELESKFRWLERKTL